VVVNVRNGDKIIVLDTWNCVRHGTIYTMSMILNNEHMTITLTYGNNMNIWQ